MFRLFENIKRIKYMPEETKEESISINQLPLDSMLTILNYLTVLEAGKAAGTSKCFNLYFRHSSYWNRFLLESCRTQSMDMMLPTARNRFAKRPQMRLTEVGCDEAGRDYIMEKISDLLAVKYGELIDDDFFPMCLLEKLLKLPHPEIDRRLAEIQLNLEPADIKYLGKSRIRGLLAGLTRQQVEHVWFYNEMADLVEEYPDMPYETYEGLICSAAIQGLRFGLSRQQVDNHWFMSEHLIAARLGVPYSDYKGMARYEVLSVISQCVANKLGITLEAFEQKVGEEKNQIVADLIGEENTIELHPYPVAPHAGFGIRRAL